MSMSVPYGFHIPADTDLFEFQRQCRDIVAPLYSRMMAEHFASSLMAIWDCSVDEEAIDASLGPIMQRFHCWTEKEQTVSGLVLMMMLRRAFRNKLITPSHGYAFSLILYPEHNGKIFGSMWNSANSIMISKVFSDALRKAGLVEGYEVFTSHDGQEKEIGKAEREQRRDAWLHVLKHHGMQDANRSIRLPLVALADAMDSEDYEDEELTSLSEDSRIAKVQELIGMTDQQAEIMTRMLQNYNPEVTSIDAKPHQERVARVVEQLRPFDHEAFNTMKFTVPVIKSLNLNI